MKSRLYLFTLLAGIACGGLLDVTTPDIARPDDLTSDAGLAALRAGAFGDFSIAYGGDATPSDAQEGQILATGLFTDEFKKTGTDPQRIAYDARRTDPSGVGAKLTTFFANLHRARHAAEATAAIHKESNVASASAVISEMTSLAGFIYVFLAEDFCSGVPVSTLSAAGDIEYGSGLTTSQLLELAIQRFDTSIARAQAATRPDLERLARIGKGRAQLNLGDFPGAAATVATVPTNFRYELRHATTTRRTQNAVFYSVNQLERWSMVNRKGGNGVDYQDAFAAGDPRTPWVVAPDGFGFDKTGGTQYYQLLYNSLTAAIPLATGAEARLIQAEAALKAGDVATFRATHNALRTTLNAASVGPVSTDTMTAAQQITFHFRERALWMYATGHRLGDMRRLIRQYGRTENTVFPTGAYYRPQYPTYGTDVNFPIPFSETNNPNSAGCIDRKA
jgi:starch-binding outer membrane protein, SusD/RagB family